MTKINSDKPLHRLTTFSRGTLNTGHTAITGTASSTGSWTLDANGNWTSVTTDGSTENRTYNQQNEVTSVGDGTLAYDNNGDYTEGGYRFEGLGYDAWRNAMTGAQTEYPDGSTYAYDALGRRITTAALTSGSPTHLYYDAYGNVIEEHVGTSTSASVQYVWSPYGVNQLVERDRDTDANGSLDERLYVQQDANGNVTSLINTSGIVVERYIYTPYGQVTVLTGSFGSRSTTSYAWNYLFQGERYDWTAGLYHMGAREYDPQLGRFLQQDPMGYVDGANRYQFVRSNPLKFRDPTGLEGTIYPWGPPGVIVDPIVPPVPFPVPPPTAPGITIQPPIDLRPLRPVQKPDPTKLGPPYGGYFGRPGRNAWPSIGNIKGIGRIRWNWPWDIDPWNFPFSDPWEPDACLYSGPYNVSETGIEHSTIIRPAPEGSGGIRG